MPRPDSVWKNKPRAVVTVQGEIVTTEEIPTELLAVTLTFPPNPSQWNTET